MVDRVEPLAHVPALSELDPDFIGAERLEQHSTDDEVESCCISPARKKSLAHNWCKVALFDVEHVGGRVDGAGKDSCLKYTLRVVKSIYNRPVLLPVVVIHRSLFLLFIINFKLKDSF